MLATFTGISLVRPDLLGSLYTPLNSRVVSFPAACGVACAAFWAFTRPWWNQKEGVALRSRLTGLVVFALLFGAANDVLTTLNWSSGLIAMKEQLARQDGCGFVSQEVFEKKLNPSGIQSWYVADVALLAQHSRHPAKILSVRSLMEGELKTNFCQDVASGFYHRSLGEHFRLLDSPYISFERLRANAAQASLPPG